MNRMLRTGIVAVLLGLGAPAVYAKLPVPVLTDEQKAKADEAKAKAAEAAKLENDQLAKAQDRAVENYRQNKGKAAMGASTPAKK